MKIVVLYTENSNQGLPNIMKVIYNTLHELNVEVEEINLKGKIPFYEGIKIKQVTDIILKLQKADAIILGTTVNMFAPTALMKAFLEHCENPDYRAILMGKNYMTVTVTDTLGEKEASEYLYKVIGLIGGFELCKIAVGGNQCSLIGTDKGLQEIIEKNVEDFYRMIRQNRKTFLSSEAYMYQNYYAINSNSQAQVYEKQPVHKPQTEQVKNTNMNPQPIKQMQPVREEVYIPDTKVNEDFDEIKSILDNIRNKATNIEKPKFDKVEAYEAQFEAFAEKQEEDIKDIAKMISQTKDDESQIKNKATYSRPQIKHEEVVHRQKTCKQMMSSLPHHFQSHLAADVQAIFQFNITGDEIFEGYLIIENSQTEFIEGTGDKADIFVYTSTDIMKDILRGKYSVQKAFMTGQLKVRGNFVLLNKLDQLYTKMS